MKTRTRIAVLAAGTVSLLGGGVALAHNDAKAADYIGPTCHIKGLQAAPTTANTRPPETIKLPSPTVTSPIECYY